jgi:hypothetical protein
MTNTLRRTIYTLGLLTMGLLGAAPTPAFAMMDYRIWYYDDVYDTFEEGDVSIGNELLTPPAWACSIKLYDPSYYRWVGEYHNTLESDDLYHDVTVRLPRPGCPSNAVVVEDGDDVIPFELGAHFLEISSHYNYVWLDEDGSNHACGFGCATLAEDFIYRLYDHEIFAFEQAIGGIKSTLLATSRQPTAREGLAAATVQLKALDTAIRKQVATRRRTNLGDRETSIRALEDAALRNLSETARRLAECDADAAQFKYGNAFIAGDRATTSIESVRQLLLAAEFGFPGRTP